MYFHFLNFLQNNRYVLLTTAYTDILGVCTVMCSPTIVRAGLHAGLPSLTLDIVQPHWSVTWPELPVSYGSGMAGGQLQGIADHLGRTLVKIIIADSSPLSVMEYLQAALIPVPSPYQPHCTL